MRTVLTIALCIVLTSCENNAQDKQVDLKTEKDSVSYAIGMSIGNNFREQKVDVDLDILQAAMQHTAIDTGKAQLTAQQADEVIQSWQQKMMAKQQEEATVKGEKNKTDGEKFLAENKSKDGVKVTGTGLQYKVIKEGNGPIPTTEDQVVCHYTGTLIDGTKFDSSHDRGEPATFPVTGVIPGWTEALQMMPVGSKWMLYIPAELGYGERGAGQDIGPNSTLIFEIELLSIAGK